MFIIDSHKHRIYLILISILFVLSSCKTNKAEVIVNSDEVSDAEFIRNIKKLLENNIKSLPSLSIDSIQFYACQDVLKDAYQSNHYNPIWVSKQVLNNNGEQLYHYLNNAEYYALLKEKYQFGKIKMIHDSLKNNTTEINFQLLAELDQLLTTAFFNIALHLDNGIYNESNKSINNNFWNNKKIYTDLLNKIISKQNLTEQFNQLEPQHPIFKRYKEAIYQFVSKNNVLPNAIQIRDYKKDSIGAIADARLALKYHHYLHDTLLNNDSAYLQALRLFQKDNGYKPDAVLGSMTARALERDNAQKFKLLVINADRWRANKTKIKSEKKYVWVNLPSYKLKIIVEDTILKEKNVVIGKANGKNATPNIISAIDRIVLWPTWSVPQSIIKNEMKSFKGYKVTKKGNYTSVVQPPGPRNALGTVKILFPNKHSVYIHDTPTKYLFNSDYRSHSHGCVRCQDPLEIASALLQLDTFKFDYDSLIRLKEKKIATKQFTLKTPIPVYLQYFTAEANWNGNLKFFPDIYKKDEEIINVLFNDVIYQTKEIKKEAKKDSTIQITKPKTKDTTKILIQAIDTFKQEIIDSLIN